MMTNWAQSLNYIYAVKVPWAGWINILALDNVNSHYGDKGMTCGVVQFWRNFF